jgi:hypothetical protein
MTEPTRPVIPGMGHRLGGMIADAGIDVVVPRGCDVHAFAASDGKTGLPYVWSTVSALPGVAVSLLWESPADAARFAAELAAAAREAGAAG